MRKQKTRNRLLEKNKRRNQQQIEQFFCISRKVFKILLPGYVPKEESFFTGACVHLRPDLYMHVRFSLDCNTGIMKYVLTKNDTKTHFSCYLCDALVDSIVRELVVATILPSTSLGQALVVLSANR